MSNLIRLIYVSEVDKATFDSDTIAQILKSARRKNAEMNITGMLVCNYDCFLQALEGPDDAVNSLYRIIADDPRHSDVTLIDKATIDKRQFGKWEMGFASSKKSVLPHSSEQWSALTVDKALDVLSKAASLKQ